MSLVTLYVTMAYLNIKSFENMVSATPSISSVSVVPLNCTAFLCSSTKGRVHGLTTPSSGQLPIALSRVPISLRRTIITVRSRHFCRRGNVSMGNVLHTKVGTLAAKSFSRNTDAVARRLLGGGMFAG